MKINTEELAGAALDWAVAKCEGHGIGVLDDPWFKPSTDWAQAGPIIEKAGLSITLTIYNQWRADRIVYRNPGPGFDSFCEYGPTPLIAVMRCYVASKLGDEVEIPQELCEKETTE